MHLRPGDPAPAFAVVDSGGQTCRLSDYKACKLLLAFFRYATCPLCNLRISALIRDYPALNALGLHIIAVFQSPPERLAQYVGRQAPPFPLVPDPGQHLYGLYGVRSSWAGLARGGVRLAAMVSAGRQGFLPGPADGDLHRIPADFLIASDQTIHRAYYGRDIGDHLPLEQIHQWLASEDRRPGKPTS